MKENKDILKERMAAFNKLKKAKVGEYLKYKGSYVRFSHDWGRSLQTTQGGSFYLGKGYMSFSGGLHHGIDRKNLELTNQKRIGSVWFFDGDYAVADGGVYYKVSLRIWKVKKGVKLRDYDILGYDIAEERAKITKEKITRINGNGQEYESSIPAIVILDELNDVCLKHIHENTGLMFENKGSWSSAQPKTSNQVLTLIMTYNFRTQYHNNTTSKNTLYLKWCNDENFKK